MVMIPALAAGSYTTVIDYVVKQVPPPNPNKVVYEVTADAPIPPKANGDINSLPLTVLGYGWLDTGSATSSGIPGVFATIHSAFTDSTHATGDKWHAHTGLVAPSTEDSTKLCLVHLESPAFSLKNAGKTIEQTLASSDATVTSADLVTAFTLTVNEVDCPAIEVPVLSESVGAIPIQVIPLS
jgi:hypothetical protein